MTADVIQFPRAFTPRVAHTWAPVAGAIADFCDVRVTVVIPGPIWTVVDYSDGEGTWRQEVQTRFLKPWRRGEGRLPARFCEDARPSDSEPEPPRAA